MDLIGLLKKEVRELNLNTEEEIGHFLYIRTGELFYFDMNYILNDRINDSEKIEMIMNKRIDIYNVTDFSVVCKSWSCMFVELLKEFNINAKVVNEADVHFLVETNSHIIYDLTMLYEDISLIKFGIKPKRNYPLGQIDYPYEELDKKIHYEKGIKTEEALILMKNELEKMKADNEYIMKIIKLIVNIPRDNIDFWSNATYINYLCDLFSIKKNIFYTLFSNEDKSEYFYIYELCGNKTKYYVYSLASNGYYRINEISLEEVEKIKEEYFVNKRFSKKLIK